MGFTEYALLIGVVIAMPLVIAGGVTLWSLKQVRYRPNKRRPGAAAAEPGTPDPQASTRDGTDPSSA